MTVLNGLLSDCIIANGLAGYSPREREVNLCGTFERNNLLVRCLLCAGLHFIIRNRRRINLTLSSLYICNALGEKICRIIDFSEELVSRVYLKADSRYIGLTERKSNRAMSILAPVDAKVVKSYNINVMLVSR